MKPALKHFIMDNITVIDRDQYQELYCKLKNTFKNEATLRTRELTEFLIDCNVNPLEYMPTVPHGYLCRSDLLDHIVIPENIDLVGRAAFMDSDLKSVSFSDRSKCTHIIAYAFQSCHKLETVILFVQMEYYIWLMVLLKSNYNNQVDLFNCLLYNINEDREVAVLIILMFLEKNEPVSLLIFTL